MFFLGSSNDNCVQLQHIERALLGTHIKTITEDKFAENSVSFCSRDAGKLSLSTKIKLRSALRLGVRNRLLIKTTKGYRLRHQADDVSVDAKHNNFFSNLTKSLQAPSRQGNVDTSLSSPDSDEKDEKGLFGDDHTAYSVPFRLDSKLESMISKVKKRITWRESQVNGKEDFNARHFAVEEDRDACWNRVS